VTRNKLRLVRISLSFSAAVLLLMITACQSSERVQPDSGRADGGNPKAVSVGSDQRGIKKLDISDEDAEILIRFLRGKRFAASVDESVQSRTVSVGSLIADQIKEPSVGNLVTWFNFVPDLDDNPYARTARSEINRALASELSFSGFSFNPVVAKALQQAGVTSRAGLEQLDVDSFATSKALITKARDLVSQALLDFGYAGIFVTVNNPWTELDLEINGNKIGTLVPRPTAQYRRFLVQLSGDADGNRFVDFSIETPYDATGANELRFHESVELRQSMWAKFEVSPALVPALSIGMTPGNPTGTPVVLAGDTVALTVESPIESELTDIVWIELAGASTERVETQDILDSTGGSTPYFGLIAWAEIRDMVVAEKTGWRPGAPRGFYGTIGSDNRAEMLAGGYLNERVIGTGSSIEWTPQIESPNANIVVLARNKSGLWGIAKRHVPVIDLRPAAWARPYANIRYHKATAHEAAQLDWSHVNQVALVAGILGNMTFLGIEDRSMKIEICTTPFSEAHMPARSLHIDYGDGSDEQLELRAGGVILEHSYAEPGRYVIAVTATGLDQLERKMRSYVSVQPKPVAAEVIHQTTSPATDEDAEDTAAQSAARLFGDAVWRWAEKVANALADEHPEVEISHIHSHLQRAVVDLFDEALVQRFMAHGASVFERDAAWTEAVSSRGSLESRGVFESEDARLGSESESRHVVAYKLIQAGVTLEDVGVGLAVRTSHVRAYVRIHEPATGLVTFAREISTEVSDLVLHTELSDRVWEGWNDQPSDWMIYQDRVLDWRSPVTDTEQDSNSESE